MRIGRLWNRNLLGICLIDSDAFHGSHMTFLSTNLEVRAGRISREFKTLRHSLTAPAPSAVAPRSSADSGTPPISAPLRRLARGSYGSKSPALSVSTHAPAGADTAGSGTPLANRCEQWECLSEWRLAPLGSLSRRNSSDSAQGSNSPVGLCPSS
jgi:hypothetical protein